MQFSDVILELTTRVKLDDLCDRLKIDTEIKGANKVALCPFHNDTKPSMRLYDDNPKGGSQFHCFACNAHGNIFELVKQVQGVDFKESVKWLADEYGITLSTMPQKNKSKNVDSLFSTIANDYYLYALQVYKDKQNIDELTNYIVNVRKFNLDIIEKANLTLVSGKNLLVTHLSNLALKDEEKLILFDEYEHLGLIKKSLNSAKNHKFYLPLIQELQQSYYDHFSEGRVLFPLQNETGKILGFAGGVTNESVKGPKYLFTKGLKKGSILYRSNSAFENLQKSRDELTSLYICEGLLDALRLESLGYAAVAILGASLSAEQTKLICSLSLKMKEALHVYLFLDNDNAGIIATENAIKSLLKLSDPGSLELSILHDVNTSSKVDPDSYLQQVANQEQANEKLLQIEYPLPAIFLASKLKISTSSIRKNEFFNDLPYSKKFNAAKTWSEIFDNIGRDEEQFLKNFEKEYKAESWYGFLTSQSIHKSGVEDLEYTNKDFLTDTSAKVKHAIKVAQSSGLSSALPNDISEWRRLDMSSVAVETILEDRFNLNTDLRPLEPLNTFKTSRKIGDSEARIMHMHCAEDLISHQYLMNEILTQSYDNFPLTHSDKYHRRLSDCIPATRYYRDDNLSASTGNRVVENLVLSFAYQIDMELLEGAPPKKEGMFRPYFNSWKDFTASISMAAKKMPLVHMVRLDLKRYYDELQRYVVRDALRNCIPVNIFENERFATLIKGEKNRTKEYLINFILEQSFGYSFYDSKTGEIQTKSSQKGIPQGPDLSSFIANLVLFKVDEVARDFIQTYKNEETDYSQAHYARYVDDMVIIADSANLLAKFRSTLEDSINDLQLEIVAKEQPAAMLPDDFLRYLGKGRALAASGPTGVEQPIDFNELKFIDKIERYQALGLLNDKALYASEVSMILKKVYMAANSEDLRLNDLKKVSKWLWYAAASKFKSGPIEPKQVEPLIKDYLVEWSRAVSNINTPLCMNECYWEDPLLIALDGLKSNFESFNWVDDELTNQEKESKDRIRKRILELVSSKDFFQKLKFYGSSLSEYAIQGWGVSAKELVRTYWQKLTYLEWEAHKMLMKSKKDMPKQTSNKNTPLAKSLRRLTFTNADLYQERYTGLHEFEGPTGEKLYQICMLLQEIYHSLGLDEKDGLAKVQGHISSLKSDMPESCTLGLFSLLVGSAAE
ncbi:CHC2 zinc finger domain-containing protein [uncultured Pseudoalteromonas sp.]|mgnify:CR=1 FL=1|uniref:CHC2 zinc finger domain-containing protein n=1 Tax=uncultured Pseudoalteromonas sp. TaxID=114053 RepID=UPI002594B710|nr:CHC2 zinc finger domain-containing protein [uncultured Pseudoalteromonas sp.]